MKESILIFVSSLILNAAMVTHADSNIDCYKCANSSALADHDWRIFNITIDPYAYKPCAPKFDHSILEVVRCTYCASIVDKTTQKRKVIYRGCYDKKIRLEEKRKVNGERRFHLMISCQRSLCNSAVGSYLQSSDSFLSRIWRWFRLSNSRLIHPLLLNDQLLIIGLIQICYKWFYASNVINNFIQR